MKQDELNIPQVVDLGLPSGTLWADKNVGAETENDAGLYLAWGETEPKESYYLNNYKFWQTVEAGEHEETYIESHTEEVQFTDEDGTPMSDEDGNPIMEEQIIEEEKTRTVTDYETKMVKYNGEDGKKTLDADDDAATVLIGEGWSMPTAEQWQELFSECDVKVLDDSVRFSRNGKSIVLPRCGVMYQDMKPVELPSRCNYWSKDKERDEHNAIRAIVDVNGNSATTYMDWENRITGMPVRAIKNI